MYGTSDVCQRLIWEKSALASGGFRKPATIVDGGILALIKQWLKAPVIGEEDENGTRKTVGGGKANSIGWPQGGVISPLLANLYLHLLDRIWEKHRLKGKLGAHLVRYADDFVVLCKRGVEEPLKVIRHVLDRLDLTLNETKTHIVNAQEAGFNFLGFTIRMSRGAKSGKPYPNVRPSDKAVQKIKTRLTELTQRELTCIPLDDVVRKVNRSLRGWVNYFHSESKGDRPRFISANCVVNPFRVKICPIWPCKHAKFQPYLIEHLFILECRKNPRPLACDEQRHINNAVRTIVAGDEEPIARQHIDGFDPPRSRRYYSSGSIVLGGCLD